MTNSNISEIMAQYDSRHALLEDFTNTLRILYAISSEQAHLRSFGHM